jgi:hypothetical protein
MLAFGKSGDGLDAWPPGYPLLGPAAFLAWAAQGEETDIHSGASVEIAERYMASAPTLRLPSSAYRVAARMPNRFMPAWRPGAAISAGATLGWIVLGLEGKITESRFRHMARSVARCFDEVQRVSRRGHYINGNYQIPLCELAYLHSRINKSDGGHEEYERCLEFLCYPERTSRRWHGRGLRIDQTPARPDWHDAVGYFSEVEGLKLVPTQTFDPEYVQLQLDYMIRLWLLTRDDRIVHFCNALINAILPLTDRGTWRTDGRGGSRRNQIVPFWNAGLATLALHDPRPEFTDEMVRAQFTTAIEHEYHNRAVEHTIDPYCLRGYGLTFLGILVASSPKLFNHRALSPSFSSAHPTVPNHIRR